jgi:hypothetical protein
VGGGSGNTASACFSTVSGGCYNTASGDVSTVGGGLRASATRWGESARASGQFSAPGDAQITSLIARNKTTNATPVTLFLDGSAARLTIPSGKALFASVNIAGILSTGAKAAHYMRKVAIKNVGGTTALIGSVSTIGTDVEDDGDYDVAITADNTNDALQINVTGKAAETLRWVTHVDGIEIAYGT